MRRFTILLTVLALLMSACAEVGTVGSTTTQPTTPGVFGAALHSFSQCDDLLDYYIEQALPLVGPYGLPGYGPYGPAFLEEDAVRGAPGPITSPSTTQASSTKDYSGTNVQVAGVDEADIVKTDGNRIFALVNGSLQIALPKSNGVEIAGSLELRDWWPSQMLLFGDTVVLIGQDWQGGPRPLAFDTGIAPPQSAVTRLAQVDVSDPYRPKLVQTLWLDGGYVSSRLVGSRATVAITSSPVGFDWAYPEGSGLRSERVATSKNQQIVRDSKLDNWLPYYVLESAGRTTEGRLLDCSSVMAPNEFSGLNTLSILTFDLEDGIGSWDDAGVVASGSTLYATAEHVYVATQPWMDWGLLEENEIRDEAERYRSKIHMFDTSGSPRYVASGEVTGFLLNQFSMDEYDGSLRVASTTAPQGWWWSDESESLVTILQLEGNRLAEVGRIDGLGRGERIFGVRFIDDIGYVVTFRQTDPLYTIDLSNPRRPSVVGELKILGYSAYLHPVGEGLLLGLGQDADKTGRTKGTQLSLFDVSDPAHPVKIDQVAMDGGYSQAENDHHAFTFWNGLVLTPYEGWERDGSSYDTGVLAVRVDGRHLTFEKVLRAFEDGPISGKDLERLEPWRWTPIRTMVIGPNIYTITQGGIAVHDFDTLERVAFERF
ncbi:MAG: hypothetical protein GWP04_01565 [Gammaproteobacteria bacterium]|nr:hypothetical protein [Gammaproteobacteria bacterium]